ncbi:LytR C-terminal domain-containing protein [Streptomyces sp.]|jgi:LytR cell envelope-related transcriptional attenuator|uniref:LytR C-terminal domain-containing protein n=1 Tax=Streptomyces sp. TaxID=1931 RepID=UPI0025FC9502|nr:LytR C-terminal domain-containing protein [Streptomyces sp.]
MSMLTPPGMGGQYRITGDKYPRMRPRRRRARLVLSVVASVAALGLVGWGSLQLIDVFTGGGGTASAAGSAGDCVKQAAASASPVAGTSATVLPKPAQITVNVYNATTRTGLAKDTADELKKRGFKIGNVGNAPAKFDQKVKGTAILLGPATALKTSLPVLATQVTAADQRTEAGRKGAAVDLIIGNAFKALTPQATATKAITALSAPRPTASTTKKTC